MLKDERTIKKLFKRNRLIVLWLWLMFNLLAGYLMTFLSRNGMSGLLNALAYSILFFQVIKIGGMLVYKYKVGTMEQGMAIYQNAFDLNVNAKNDNESEGSFERDSDVQL